MTKKTYYILWAGLYILCAGLSFIPEPADFLRVFLTAFSILFFLPPVLLAYFAGKQGDRMTLKVIRNLSAASLALTLVLLIVNFLSFMAPEALGNLLYTVLLFVSVPMVCSGYWVLSLFLWACLLMGCQKLLKS